MRWILDLDQWLFEKINQHWTNSLLDIVMPIVTDLTKILWVTYGIIPLGIGFWIYKQRRKAVRVVLEVALVLAISDMVAFRIFKPIFERARPYHDLTNAILRTSEHVGPSFPSNHATNSFAVATLIVLYYPRLALPLFLLAALISYSRVYVGVHYPLDVCAGAALGTAIALIFRKVSDRATLFLTRIRN